MWKPVLRATYMFYYILFSKQLLCKVMHCENLLLMTMHCVTFSFDIYFSCKHTVCLLKPRNNWEQWEKKPPKYLELLPPAPQKKSQGNFNACHKPISKFEFSSQTCLSPLHTKKHILHNSRWMLWQDSITFLNYGGQPNFINLEHFSHHGW